MITEAERARGVGRTSRIYDRGDGLDSSFAGVSSPSGVSTAVLEDVKRRMEARNKLNPLWERTLRSFEREWGRPWEFMDGVQRGLVRVMYKHEKKEAAKPKRELKPIQQPTYRGPWDPAPGFGGK